MSPLLISVVTILIATPSQVVVYEGNTLPETEGWERNLGGTPGAQRSIENGWLVHFADLPPGWTDAHGNADSYRISLAGFSDAETFFIEWRAWTDNPAWVLNLSAVPAGLSAASDAGVYHTTLTEEIVQLFRRSSIPLVFVEISPGFPHVYRVDLRGRKSFGWYIDGVLVEGGQPLHPYPDSTARVVWSVRRSYVDATTAWDYVRFGVIPQDGSGDFDSDSAATLFDYYFVQECVENLATANPGGPGSDAGPGCRFADFNADLDVDLGDFAEFQNRFAPADSPTPRR